MQLPLLFCLAFLTACGVYTRKDCYESGTGCTPPSDNQRTSAPSTPEPGDGELVPPEAPAVDAKGCTVSTTEQGAIISCPDGTSAAVRNGTTGAPGSTGAEGPAGPAGRPGADGTAGIVGAAGPAGVAGPAGPTGAVGPVGPVGDPGITGAPGTGVVAVKLCADSTSAFPEYGIQIGTSLYAVYWGTLNGASAPGAFLAQLTPGRYESTNGSGCQFTVNPDGTITR